MEAGGNARGRGGRGEARGRPGGGAGGAARTWGVTLPLCVSEAGLAQSPGAALPLGVGAAQKPLLAAPQLLRGCGRPGGRPGGRPRGRPRRGGRGRGRGRGPLHGGGLGLAAAVPRVRPRVPRPQQEVSPDAAHDHAHRREALPVPLLPLPRQRVQQPNAPPAHRAHAQFCCRGVARGAAGASGPLHSWGHHRLPGRLGPLPQGPAPPLAALKGTGRSSRPASRQGSGRTSAGGSGWGSAASLPLAAAAAALPPRSLSPLLCASSSFVSFLLFSFSFSSSFSSSVPPTLPPSLGKFKDGICFLFLSV